MNFEEIKEIIRTPRVRKYILGAYDGAYTLGIGRARGNEGDYVITLLVEDDEPEGFPEEVSVNGHSIPVVVQGSFEAPRAAPARASTRRHNPPRKDAA
jgi:hypothetical protein